MMSRDFCSIAIFYDFNMTYINIKLRSKTLLQIIFK